MGKREPILDASELQWQRHGQHYSLWQAQHLKPVLHGLMFEQQVQQGLWLHATEVEFHQPLCSSGEIGPGLKIIVMLQGQVQAQFGETQLLLGGPRDNCVLLQQQDGDGSEMARTAFKRIVSQAGHQSQVVLTCGQSWLHSCGLDLAQHGPFARVPRTALSSRSLGASTTVLSAAKQLLNHQRYATPLGKLEQESHALALLVAALNIQPQPQSLKPRAQQRIAQLLNILHEDLANNWSLTQLAQQLGSNPTTLQQHFRQSTGYSIADYVRRQRLQRAHQQLSEGLSATEAALNAGYNSPANFATAFKRHFGISPRQVST
ncbi:helix-turn-helix transcriptional regulator [Chitinibacter fontanus]|uniref:Helix-turn-helix transcriptional regulator n=1 Tax=Chitinibacter fontanus TaxID=1737446 RepID=A0A7D5V871_9NEIS|nr:AraC family transcriptional regulator [Chitinibacter fontanus]QLI80434.1 helix-turn-helix transcriptional regulator [Chitinibacter fontanus]